MFRQWFHNKEAGADSTFTAANEAIDRFCRKLRKQYASEKEVPKRFIRLELWARGFTTSLDELEGAQYCAQQYRRLVHASIEDAMTQEELEAYRLHVYFYKDAFIRIFSILDKLGFFLDDLYNLDTGKVKRKFSYFTVLRQMHHTQRHAALEQRLYEVKEKYQEPLNLLRKRRNLEIHAINVDLIDDQVRTHQRFVDRYHIEPLDDNLSELSQGVEMVCQSLRIVFEYAGEIEVD